MSTFMEVFLSMIAAQAFRAFLLAVISTHRNRRINREYMKERPNLNLPPGPGIARTMLGFY